MPRPHPLPFYMYHLCVAHISMVSCQKGPTRHSYAWQIGPFWQDTLDLSPVYGSALSPVYSSDQQPRLLCQITLSFRTLSLYQWSFVCIAMSPNIMTIPGVVHQEVDLLQE